MGCCHPENLLFYEGLFPNLGDKKPESRFFSFNSASQTFVNYAFSFTRTAPTVNSLLFTVSVVRTSSKYPSRRIPQEFFSVFLLFFSIPRFHWPFCLKIQLPSPLFPSKTPSAPLHFFPPTHLFCLYPSAQPRYFPRRNVL